MARMLLVEDDNEIAGAVAGELVACGHTVDHAADGEDGLARALASAYDVFIVDRLLPRIDGLALIGRLRANARLAPVLIVSALDAVDERVRGLRSGGDDYLTKPFALAELTARVEALLRRPNDSRVTALAVEDLELDLIGRGARRGGRAIDLLPREFTLLEYLMRRPGRVVTRAMLLEDLWGFRFALRTNVVDVHISKLRRKIEAPGEPPLLRSIRGVGFMLGAAATA